MAPILSEYEVSGVTNDESFEHHVRLSTHLWSTNLRSQTE